MHLHHSCSRGMGNARRSLNRQSHRPRTEQSPTCWPTSPAGGVCPLPRLQAECQGSCREMASKCPYGNPSGTEVFLFEPFCRNRRKRKHKNYCLNSVNCLCKSSPCHYLTTKLHAWLLWGDTLCQSKWMKPVKINNLD